LEITLVKFFPLITAFLWGTTYVATKFALSDFSPMGIAAGRAVFAYLGLVVFYLILGKRAYLIPKKQDFGVIATVSLFGVVLFWWLLNVGLHFTTATNSALLVSIHPLFVIMLSPLILKEAVTRQEWAGVLVGLIGSFLVITKGQIAGLIQSQTLLGDAISLLAGIFFAIYVLLGRKYAGKLHPGYLTVNAFGFGSLILIPLSIFSGSSLAIWHGTGLAISAVVWLGLACSAAAFLLLLTALEKTRAAKASVYILFAPVVAAITAYFLLKETIGLGAVVGGLFIICGILLTALAKPAGLSEKSVAEHTQKA